MSTVYTLNGKVLKNTANDKWLKKKEAPAGFVMNASNAHYRTSGAWTYLYWEGPDFPNGYDGVGKQCVIVNNNGQARQYGLQYFDDSINGGPDAINAQDLITGTTTMLSNLAGTASGYGKYLGTMFGESDGEEGARAWAANVTITIVDP